MESIEMIKFIVLVFALFAVSNKKLKIQYQKHQYFYSFQKRKKEKKKILSPLSSLLPFSDSL